MYSQPTCLLSSIVSFSFSSPSEAREEQGVQVDVLPEEDSTTTRHTRPAHQNRVREGRGRSSCPCHSVHVSVSLWYGSFSPIYVHFPMTHLSPLSLLPFPSPQVLYQPPYVESWKKWCQEVQREQRSVTERNLSHLTFHKYINLQLHNIMHIYYCTLY